MPSIGAATAQEFAPREKRLPRLADLRVALTGPGVGSDPARADVATRRPM
jgi:hypothetical protein